jgi:CheY-like chemotaxis protein
MTKGGSYILVADDDPDDQEMLAERFSRSHPEVRFLWMGNGFEVLDYLRSCSDDELPRLLVLDYKMPGLTGAEVLADIQHEKRLRDIPKVVWSTSNNREYIDKALKNGALQYFAKPVDMASFDRLVARLMQLYQAERGENN